MEINATYTPVHYNSKVSFQPLLTVLKRTLSHGTSAGAKKLYSGILEYADQHPELQDAIDDLSILEPHREWMEMLQFRLRDKNGKGVNAQKIKKHHNN